MINEVFEARLELSLTYFLLIRQLHRKPIIYNFSYRSLSKQLKCSVSTLHYHLEKLAQRGYIEVIGGNLHLTSTNKLKERYKTCLVPVRTAKNKQKQLTFLRATRIKRNLALQSKIITLRNDTLELNTNSKRKFSKQQIKTIRKKAERLSALLAESSKSTDLLLSNSKFGSLCNRSKSTGQKIQKELNRLQVIKSHRNSVKYSSNRFNKRAFYNLCLPPQYLLSQAGFVYLSLPNRITA